MGVRADGRTDRRRARTLSYYIKFPTTFRPLTLTMPFCGFAAKRHGTGKNGTYLLTYYLTEKLQAATQSLVKWLVFTSLQLQGERVLPKYMLCFRKQRESESIEKYAFELDQTKSCRPETTTRWQKDQPNATRRETSENNTKRAKSRKSVSV